MISADRPLVVIGEGLAAGMGDFSLHAGSQSASFACQVAAAMQLPLHVPLIEPPGIHAPIGFPGPIVTTPSRGQRGVLQDIPPCLPTNLAVPGYRVLDALERRPRPPVCDRDDPTQTACNLILGIVDLATGTGTALSQVESAARWRPGLTLICLGYQEALDAVVLTRDDDTPDVRRVPDASVFRPMYARILDTVTTGRIVTFTVPNPVDTAWCSTLEDAAAVCRILPDALHRTYGLAADELLTVHGLNEIGYQLFSGERSPLSGRARLSMQIASELDARVQAINDEIVALAMARGAAVVDLHKLFREVNQHGVALRSRALTGRYLGGFYRLNGMFPGSTGHAVIANAVLQTINDTFGCGYMPIDVDAVAASDPVADYRPAQGRLWGTIGTTPTARPNATRRAQNGAERRQGVRSGELIESPRRGRLQLPVGLQQILPLCKATSYFGDGISPVNCANASDARWGSTGEYLFGGLAMVDSHLDGAVLIRFIPIGASTARFELSFEDELVGDDAVLTAPQYFSMPFQHNGVSDVPGLVSSGVLDLNTGDVSELQVFVRFRSVALQALVGVNPTFPREPLSFPGPYGSAFARFEPRADGLLDFTFYGSTFVPLGNGIRWPLNFRSADGGFATVPASGTAMHPHLQLSTKPLAPEPSTSRPPVLPFNEIRELTLFTHNSSFGDQFSLEIPSLGGYAKGRSHLLGRLHLQFGPRCGNSVPVAIAALRPAGVFADMPASPIAEAFPGRLYPGPQGFYEMLRFPTRTYSLDDLAVVDDPFDIPIAAVDLDSGRGLNDVLHRGFIEQDLIFALMRVEPRTPKTSFLFRGPCQLENGPNGELGYRFKGIVRVPYPEGFLFPQPDLTNVFVAGSGSVLDPFLWLRAMEESHASRRARGLIAKIQSSLGETFSVEYDIPVRRGDPAVFNYENHTQRGSFRLLTLAAVAFTHSRAAIATPHDTVTFSGFGVWTKEGHESLQQVAAQICWSAETSYVGIQIDGGSVSNVNTKPEREQLALP